MKTRLYTYGNELVLDDQYYCGFYCVSDGKAYVGKHSPTTTELIPTESFIQQTKVSDFHFDSIIDEEVVLPNSLDSCRIPVGEVAIANAINYRLGKLQENLLFLGSKAWVFDTNSSQSILGYFAPQNNSTGFEISLSASLSSSLPAYLEDAGITDSTFLNDGRLVLIIVGRKSYYDQVVNIIMIDPQDNNKIIGHIPLTNYSMQQMSSPTFRDITQIRFSDKRLYVADAGRNNVLVYDISRLIDNEFTEFSHNMPILIKIVGGVGNEDEKYAFEYPKSIMIKDDTVQIYDSVQGSIRIFDRNLNWIQTHRKNVSLQDSNFLEYVRENNEYVTVNNDGTLVKLDEIFNKKEEIPFFMFPLSGETFLNMEVSDNISNMMYVVTNKRTILLFKSNATSYIGYAYPFVNLSGDYVYQSFVKNNTIEQDLVCMTRQYGPRTTISISRITPIYQSLLKNTYFNIYPLDNIEMTDDYHQASQFVSLRKLMYNTKYLQQMVSRQAVYTTLDQEKVHQGFIYLKDSEIPQQEEDVLGIGMNEHVSPSTINRYIDAIYQVQLNIARSLNYKTQSENVDGIPIIDDYLLTT